MVFNYESSFPGDLFYQMETPAFQVIPEKQPSISDEEVKSFGQSLGEDDLHCRFDRVFDLGYEKRPHSGGEFQEHPSKRARNADLESEIPGVSFEHSPFSEGGSNLSWVSCISSEEVVRSSPRDMEFFPRKHVVVGPNHQASVPAWRPKPTEKPPAEEIREQRLMGTLVSSPSSSSLPGGAAAACCCDDNRGSILCVRRHVMEARERMWGDVGPVQFRELGFPEMGEAVALRWAEEEEQIFHEVVAENPASAGKNFWPYLRKFLPRKSSKELVSYYFNVFILRKRALQNRTDPLNVDSDNDEWQCSEEDEEGEEEEEEEGSDCEEEGESAGKMDFLRRDEPCISSEGRGHVAGLEQRSRGVGMINGVVEHGFLMGPEGKPWELGLFGGQERIVDFLPTCHVIEEVFGEGSWAGTGSDGGEGII